MLRRWTWAVFLAGAVSLHPRDWAEPPDVTDPLLRAAPAGVSAAAQAVFEYNYQSFLSSPDDVFQINALSAFSVSGEKVGVAIAYGSYLMNGSVQEGDSPGSRLQWMMNAVQLEYGVYLAARAGSFDLLADYSRTSQHPLRDPYSQVASDLLRVGALRRLLAAPGLEALLALRFGYSDLYDFWESPLPKPRARYLVAPAVWLEQALWAPAPGVMSPHWSCFAEGEADWLFLRRGGQGTNASFRAGLRAELGALRCDLYLDGYASDDSEIRDDGPTPVGLLGWGLRLERAPP